MYSKDSEYRGEYGTWATPQLEQNMHWSANGSIMRGVAGETTSHLEMQDYLVRRQKYGGDARIYKPYYRKSLGFASHMGSEGIISSCPRDIQLI